MKKIFFPVLCFILFTSIAPSYSQTKEDAIKYNDSLVDEQKKVIKAEDALILVISQNTPEKLDEALNGLVNQIAASEEAVSKMEAFDGKTDYKDAALSLFKAYKTAAKKEYPKIVKIAKTPNDAYTQKMDDQLMKLSKEVDEKLNKEIEAFVAKQKEFSSKYKFEFELIPDVK